jgi:hypothetical protein
VNSANDPRNAAEAERTKALMVVEAQQASQKVQENAAVFRRAQAEQDALAQQFVIWKSVLGWMGTISASFIILSNGAAVSVIAWKIWQAVAMAAWLKSRQIQQDKVTGQLPAFYNNGMLTDPDAGQVLDTAQAQLASPAQIKMITDARKTGLAARASYKGLSRINVDISQSEVIDAKR